MEAAEQSCVTQRLEMIRVELLLVRSEHLVVEGEGDAQRLAAEIAFDLRRSP